MEELLNWSLTPKTKSFFCFIPSTIGRIFTICEKCDTYLDKCDTYLDKCVRSVPKKIKMGMGSNGLMGGWDSGFLDGGETGLHWGRGG